MIYSCERLKEKRKSLGYTIYDMARMLNITASFYSQIENENRRLFYDTAVAIAKILGVRPDDLFYTGKY